MHFKAQRAPVAEIKFDSRNVVWQFGLVVLCVGATASNTVFFIHPGNEPNRSCRSRIYLFDDAEYVHRNANPRSVVDCARSQVPRIQVARYDHNLLWMLRAL